MQLSDWRLTVDDIVDLTSVTFLVREDYLTRRTPTIRKQSGIK